MRTCLLVLLVLVVGCGGSDAVTDATSAPRGGEVYLAHCEACHGYDGRGSLSGADLSWRVDDLSAEDVADIAVLGSGFMDPVDLDDDEARAVGVFVVDQLFAL